MSQPDVTIRVEPGDGVSVFYLRLASETPNCPRMCKIGLYLMIKNNGTFIYTLIQLKSRSLISTLNNIPAFNHGIDIPKNDEGIWGMIGGPES